MTDLRIREAANTFVESRLLNPTEKHEVRAAFIAGAEFAYTPVTYTEKVRVMRAVCGELADGSKGFTDEAQFASMVRDALVTLERLLSK